MVIPIYGVEKYLRTALDSVVNQTLKDLQIILVDDGGKDNCPQIIDEYANKDKRIVAIHKPNGGYGSACNVGLDAAVGEYVTIFEPDDFIEPRMYETLYNLAVKHDAEVTKSNFYYYFDLAGKTGYDMKNKCYNNRHDNFTLPTSIFKLKEHPEFLYFHPSIWTCIYKRDFIEKHHIRVEEIPGAGWTDNLFQVQTLVLASRIYYIYEEFYHWRCRNRDDAVDLKDITIPLLRTKTIHQWLRDNNITDPNIWACLYKREIAYLHIIARAAKKTKIKENLALIEQMIADIDPEIINKNEYVSRYERRAIRQMHNFIKFYNRYKRHQIIKKILALRRSILCLHWTSKLSPGEQERFITILGFMFYRENPNMDVKCFARIKI